MGLIKRFMFRSNWMETLPSLVILRHEKYKPMWLLSLLALFHGLIYIISVPPWQHYDEPTHFEYARLIAIWQRIPEEGESDIETNREIANSMYRFDFWDQSVQINIFNPEPYHIGYDEKVHPPLFYILASKPIELLKFYPIELQLYAARLVSLIFYILTILASWRISSILIPDHKVSQVLIPLILLFVPSFADQMTSVNNDVLVNFCVTSLFLACARLIKKGFTLFDLIFCFLCLVVAVFSKRTAIVALFPFISVLIYTFWSMKNFRIWSVISLVASFLVIWIFSSLGYFRISAENYTISLLMDRILRSNIIDFSNVLFLSFWARFSWGQLKINVIWDFLFYVLFLLSLIGLLKYYLFDKKREQKQNNIILGIAGFSIIASYLVVYARYIILFGNYMPQGRYMHMMLTPVLGLIIYSVSKLFYKIPHEFILTFFLLFFMVFDILVLLEFWNFYY